MNTTTIGPKTTSTAMPVLEDWERAHILAGLKHDAAREVHSIEARAALSRMRVQDAEAPELVGEAAGLSYLGEAEQYRLMAEWLEGIAVTMARLQGASWAAIGASRRMTRQAAQARWTRVVVHTARREANVIQGLSDMNRAALKRAFDAGQLD